MRLGFVGANETEAGLAAAAAAYDAMGHAPPAARVAFVDHENGTNAGLLERFAGLARGVAARGGAATYAAYDGARGAARATTALVDVVADAAGTCAFDFIVGGGVDAAAPIVAALRSAPSSAA